MKRVLLWLTIAFTAGIFLFSYISRITLICISAALMIGGAVCLFMNKKDMARLLILCGISFCVSFFYFGFRFEQFYQGVEIYDRQYADIFGQVENFVRYDDSAVITIHGDISLKDATARNKKVQITLKNPGETKIKYGDYIRLWAKMYKPAEGKNLGDMDYRMYHMSKDQYLTGYADEMKITGSFINLKSPMDFANYIRDKVTENIEKVMPGDEGAFAVAMLTGDRRGMSDELDTAFRRSGTSHIVAVSGMHLVIILTIAMYVFGILKVKMRKPVIFIYIGLIWMFVLVAGMVPSALRAALMTTLFFVSKLLNRDNDSLTTLSASVLILLLVNPSILYDVGFLLSVGATASIIIYSEPIAGKLKFLPKTIRSIAAVTLAAQIGTLPISAYFFGTIATLGIFANIIICPFLTVITVVCIMTAIGIPFAHYAATYSIKYIIFVAKLISSVKFSVVPVKSPDIFAFAAYLLLCVALYYALNKKDFLYPLNGALIIILFISIASRGYAYVSFLNVGNGDCAFLELSGHTAMIDSGGSEYTDIAENVIIPYLNRNGTSKIDTAFITHYHNDHSGAYQKLIEEERIKTIVLPEGIDVDGTMSVIVQSAKKHGVNVVFIKDKSKISFADDIYIETMLIKIDNDENNSMVYKLTYGNEKVLFTGDIGVPAEELLLKGYIDCDILKVPHHGSDTSGSEGFIRAVNPEAAVVQVGRNYYGHPSREVIERYERLGIPVYRNDLNGTVIFKISRDKIKSVKLQKG